MMEVGFPQNHATTLHLDNMSAIELTKNSAIHQRTKHIEIAYPYRRRQYKIGRKRYKVHTYLRTVS
jgi:hypothetical protein